MLAASGMLLFVIVIMYFKNYYKLMVGCVILTIIFFVWGLLNDDNKLLDSDDKEDVTF